MPILSWSGWSIRVLAAAIVGVGAVAPAGPGRVGGQALPTDAARAAAMRDHYGRVMVLHDAVIRGDLPAVKDAATSVALHEPSVAIPEKGKRYPQVDPSGCRPSRFG